MKSATLDVISGLNPEDEAPPEKKISLQKDAQLEELIRIFSEYPFDEIPGGSDISYRMFSYAPEKIAAAYITRLALAVRPADGFSARTLGAYLSALIHKSSDTHHTLHLEAQTYPLDRIGVKLPRGMQVTVRGNVGYLFGHENEGELLLFGSAGNFAACINKGTVTIYGNAGHDLGWCNEGTVYVHGSSGVDLGFENKGMIRVDGNITKLNSFPGVGKIYHNGVLIVENGRRLR